LLGEKPSPLLERREHGRPVTLAALRVERVRLLDEADLRVEQLTEPGDGRIGVGERGEVALDDLACSCLRGVRAPSSTGARSQGERRTRSGRYLPPRRALGES
jgi:hypothetical protein